MVKKNIFIIRLISIMIGCLIISLITYKFKENSRNTVVDYWENQGYDNVKLQILEICKDYMDTSDYAYKNTIDYTKVSLYELRKEDLELVEWINENNSSVDVRELSVVRFGDTSDHDFVCLVYNKDIREVVGIIPIK